MAPRSPAVEGGKLVEVAMDLAAAVGLGGAAVEGLVAVDSVAVEVVAGCPAEAEALVASTAVWAAVLLFLPLAAHHRQAAHRRLAAHHRLAAHRPECLAAKSAGARHCRT